MGALHKKLLRTLREQQVERQLRPRAERAAFRLWAFAALRPRLYAFLTRHAARALRALGGANGMIRKLPFDPGWTLGRDFP